MFLDGGRKPENPERTHAHIGRTCRLHTERPQVGIEPGTQLKMFNDLLSALTLLIVVVFHRGTGGGHLLDLPSGLLCSLEGPQLVLLLVDPGGSEASVVL